MRVKHPAHCPAYRKGSRSSSYLCSKKKKCPSVFTAAPCGREEFSSSGESDRAKILSSVHAPFISQKSVPWGPPTEMSFLTEFPFHLLEEAITTNEVINQLLHHVGAMCIHQLNLLATNPNLPITSVLGKQHPIEAHHLSSICDIMEKAMVNGDTCIIRCILVVFQVNALF